MIFRYQGEISFNLTALHASFAVVVGHRFQLLVHLAKQGLVQSELVVGHFSRLSMFLSHLLHQEVSIFLVDPRDAFLQPSFLLVIVLLVDIPHFSLHPQVCLLLILSLSLLGDLACQEGSHFLLLVSLSLLPSLLEQPLSHFLFVIVALEHGVFVSLLLFHLLKNIISHSAHEVLGSLLPLLHFVVPVPLLLVEHLGVLILSLQILESLSFFFLLLPSLVLLVLIQHFLEILALLLPLLLLHIALVVHLASESVEVRNFLSELLLLLDALSFSLLLELLVSAHLVVHDFCLHAALLLLLALLEELSVLFGEVVVGLVLLLLLVVSIFFGFDLPLELLSDQAFPLGLPQKCLFLLLVVKHDVELLDGSPLVVLVDLREHLGPLLLGARDRNGIQLLRS